jgi:hypothetical protein
LPDGTRASWSARLSLLAYEFDDFEPNANADIDQAMDAAEAGFGSVAR